MADDGRMVPAWVLNERAVLVAAVNAHRADSGLPPVDDAPVRHVENVCVGHADYGLKLSLRLADLATSDHIIGSAAA
ncbi:hypothetical protein R8Z50_22245 [Longispora sp. K20-0274]|uniref:hypothetical protein n=1 Tax=Longispora sp. K20-0274 TaxID=3088255 RepID=UPI00399AD1A5